MIGLVIIIVYAYNLGRVRFSAWMFLDVVKIIIKDLKKISTKEKKVSFYQNSNNSFMKWKNISNQKKTRLIMVMVLLLSNMALCLYFSISGKNSGAANYLLAIFLFNLVCYTAYYCVMKLKKGECLGLAPCTYLACCLLATIPSVYFFTQAMIITKVKSQNYFLRHILEREDHNGFPGRVKVTW